MEEEMLQPNPTNLHTHGLIVEPRKADKADPTYGDYVTYSGIVGNQAKDGASRSGLHR